MKTISGIIIAGILALTIFTTSCQKTEQLSQQDVAAVNGMEEELQLLKVYNDSLAGADSAHFHYFDSLVAHHDSMYWWHHSQYSHSNLYEDHHHDANNDHHEMGENHNGHHHEGHAIDSLIDNPLHGNHEHNGMHDEDHDMNEGEGHYHTIDHHDMIDSMEHYHARITH